MLYVFLQAVLAGVMLLMNHAKADFAEQWQSCTGKSDVSSDQRIASCTVLTLAYWQTDHIRSIAYGNRAIVYADEGQYDPSIADFTEAIKLEPESAVAYFNRGTIYLRTRQYDPSIADFTEAIKLDPKYQNAYGARGSAYDHRGQYNLAIADYTEAIKLDPKDVAAYRDRSRAYLYTNVLANALADASQASAIDPKDAYSALWLDIIGQRNNVPSSLSLATAQIDMTLWPAPIIRMYLGQLTPAETLAAADNSDTNRRKGQVCEADFYSGELALRTGAKDETIRLFRLAASDCPRNFVEWDAAIAELKALGIVL